jgi:hypothetical protein
MTGSSPLRTFIVKDKTHKNSAQFLNPACVGSALMLVPLKRECGLRIALWRQNG